MTRKRGRFVKITEKDNNTIKIGWALDCVCMCPAPNKLQYICNIIYIFNVNLLHLKIIIHHPYIFDNKK